MSSGYDFRSKKFLRDLAVYNNNAQEGGDPPPWMVVCADAGECGNGYVGGKPGGWVHSVVVANHSDTTQIACEEHVIELWTTASLEAVIAALQAQLARSRGAMLGDPGRDGA